MEKINTLKEKHKVPTIQTVNEIIRTGFCHLQDNLKYQDQQLLELDMKLGARRSEMESLEESLDAKENTLRDKLIEYALACDNSRDLEADKNNLLSEIHQLEFQRNSIKNKKPSKKDLETLEHGRKKLDDYKQLTGVRWDFGAPKETIKGYITNGKDHVHVFNYRKKEQDSSKLEDELWKEVAKGCSSIPLTD